MKKIARAAQRLPISRGYLERKQLREANRLQADEIIGLHEALDRLQDANNTQEAELEGYRNAPQEQMHILWPVAKDDLARAAFGAEQPLRQAKNPPYTFNWVIPPMGETSGGHTTILRIVQYLESQGHRCRLYIYDPMQQVEIKLIKERLKSYPVVKAPVFYNATKMADCDAVFATSWQTAYPVANYQGGAKKFYFVQDFEPFFEPVGTYYALAENTYRFGLHGISIGGWLPKKLKAYDMSCDSFEFGVSLDEYQLTNPELRKKVLFYARPVTPRRGFELGILSLELFHRENPDYEIHLVGWDVANYDIPFAHVNHGILRTEELNALYNQCAAGLVLSFTNMSLLPLELLAAGCMPVVNDGDNTRSVGYETSLSYADPLPRALADRLTAAVNDQQPTHNSEQAKKFDWGSSYERFMAVIQDQLTKV